MSSSATVHQQSCSHWISIGLTLVMASVVWAVEGQPSTRQPYLYRVDCGGLEGHGFSADQPFKAGSYGYVGESTAVTSDRTFVYGDAPMPVIATYRTTASGPLVYRFAVPNGRWFVHLHIAEPTVTALGGRLLDVHLQGRHVLRGYDTFWACAFAGLGTKSDRSPPPEWSAHRQGLVAQVDDGHIELRIDASAGRPLINAIEIEPAYADRFTPAGRGTGQALAPWPESVQRDILVDAFDELSAWTAFGITAPTGGVLKLSAGQFLHRDVAVPTRYLLEARMRLSGAPASAAARFSIADDDYVLDLELRAEGLRCARSSGVLGQAETTPRDIPVTWSADGWHTLAAAVHRGIAHLYLDGRSLAALPLPRVAGRRSGPAQPGRIVLAVDAGAAGGLDVDRLRLYDERYVFQDRSSATGGEPAAPWQADRGQWRTAGSAAGTVIAGAANGRPAVCWLTTHGRDIDFSARVAWDGDVAPAFGLALDGSRDAKGDQRLLWAGCIDQAWAIESRLGDQIVARTAGRAVAASESAGATLRLITGGGSARLFIGDGAKPVAELPLAEPWFGMPALHIRSGAARFSALSYAGEDPACPEMRRLPVDEGPVPQMLTRTALNNRVVFEVGDRLWSVIRLDRRRSLWPPKPTFPMLWSDDHGLTWSHRQPTAAMAPNDIVRPLADGSLFAVHYRNAMTRRSTDGGSTWQDLGPMDADPRIGANMPGKLAVTASGRILLVCQDNAGPVPRGQHIEDYGLHNVVRYSDDGGRNWRRSMNELNIAGTGVNIQEASVTELSDGRLKLFCRGDGGTLWETTSEDGGVSWDARLQPTALISPVCAFSIDRDPVSGYHYIFWNYDNVHETMPASAEVAEFERRGVYRAWRQFPRGRAALAVSRDDTATWEFLATAHGDEGVGPPPASWRMNHTISIGRRYIYCGVTGFDGTPIYRFDKTALRVRAMFPGTR